MAEIAYLFHKDYLTDASGQKYFASPYLARVQDTAIQARIAALAAGWVTNVTALEDVPGQLSDLAALISTANLAYTTKAIMDADTGQDDDTLALVFNDSTAANNGLYVSVSGAWSATTLQLANADDLAAKADASLTISGGGLATGGGDLSANRTITVTEASEAEAQAGTSETVVLTPRRGTDLVDQRRGAVDGLASLDSGGKVPVSELPDAVLGTVQYQGTWNASTNTPTIPAAAAGNKGFYYRVATAGSTAIDGVSEWAVGDWIVSNGTIWEKIDNSESVTTVAGKSGAVTLVKGDVGLGNVDNTADANKPVSTAQQAALDAIDVEVVALQVRNAELSRVGLFSPILVGSRWVQPTEVSFDLYVEKGYYLDTGEVYDPAVEAVAANAWWVESDTDVLDLFQRRAGGNWIRYRIERDTDAARNQDIWHITSISAATRSGGAWVIGDGFTSVGEIEIAIKENGKDDFMGGSAHGNQELTEAILLIDGIQKTLGASADYSCNRVQLIQSSNLYQYGTTETPFPASPTTVAEVTTRWDFDSEGYFWLHNYVDWQSSHDLDWAYLAMLPLDSDEFDSLAFSPTYAEAALPVATSSSAAVGEKHVLVWGANGYSAELLLSDNWESTLRLRVADLSSKHKIYASNIGVGSGSPGSVTSATIWRTSARYRIENTN